MEKKAIVWKTKGMNQDFSVSALKNEYVFENRNLRLSTKEDNTLMSWVNERGTEKVNIKIFTKSWDNNSPTNDCIYGNVLGTAVINHKLVLFTTIPGSEGGIKDRIYVLGFDNKIKEEDSDYPRMVGYLLYQGLLNFDINHPIETLVFYEAEHIQKVYWVDGINQPRMINIAIVNRNDVGVLVERDIEALKRWYHLNGPSTTGAVDTFFDFVPAIRYTAQINITQEISGGGTFAPGVIQYCCTYINKYRQQSNIFYVSPMYYLALKDRGAGPEEKTTCNFTITVDKADTNFEYIRIYSVHRSSLDGETAVKMLTDLPIVVKDNVAQPVYYVDNGTVGGIVSSYQLLYAGGSEIHALTMANKDTKLFLGNIEEPNSLINEIHAYFRDPNNQPLINFRNDGLKAYTLDETSGLYSNTNTLKKNHREISTFKGGEHYRFGFQLQKATGEWSEPVWVGDVTNDKYPSSSLYDNIVNLVWAESEIDLSFVNTNIYKRIRPVIVYPNIQDRKILCQGVLNPTVFNVRTRKTGYPYAQASWYFRPYIKNYPMANSPVASSTSSNNNIEVLGEKGILESYPYDGNFSDAGTPKIVYVLTGTFTNDTMFWQILKEKKIWFGVNEGRRSHSFYGVIYIESIGTNLETKKYAFLSETDWYADTRGFISSTSLDSQGGSETLYQLNWTLAQDPDNPNAGRSFIIYNGLGITDNVRLVYNNQYQDYEVYKFNFCDNAQSYTVLFHLSGSDNSSLEGVGVEFRHYAPLYTDKDAQSEGSNAGETDIDSLRIRQSEIQGSKNIYYTPYDSPITGELKSNTQFFIDQSIVTLNSPDIEFDADVHTWGTENLGLRIVGAIPITATSSSHNIMLSSSQIQAGYDEEKATDWGIDALFGRGELDFNVRYNNISRHAGKRLVSEFLWEDSVFKDLTPEKIKTENFIAQYLVYPWQRSGAMTNDPGQDYMRSALKTKKESNLLYSYNTEYFREHGYAKDLEFGSLNAEVTMTENSQIINCRLSKQCAESSDINYYPNVETILYNTDGYCSVFKHLDSVENKIVIKNEDLDNLTTPIYMKYNSTSHMVISFNGDTYSDGNVRIPILPCWWNGVVGDGAEYVGLAVSGIDAPHRVGRDWKTYWGDILRFRQPRIDMSNMFKDQFGNSTFHSFLWLGELYKIPVSAFGGNSKEAIKLNKWIVAGETKVIPSNGKVTLEWLDGDTYYQRYDCLKTYAATREDTNQLVEVLSFLCESRVNLDGRYDKWRGRDKLYDITPDVYNKINTVYSQRDNFFLGMQYNNDELDKLQYPNTLYFTKNKTLGADVDEWTNVVLASTISLDGKKGKISKVTNFNDRLLVFQDRGVSQVLYNENVQVATEQGIPIEIANSKSVQGVRYFGDDVGCSNKWSVVSTLSGIYFIDSYSKSIYVFDGQFKNISTALGFDAWCKNNIKANKNWTPNDFNDAFVSYYDPINQEILFVNTREALSFSEKIGTFTSFYDYGNTPYFCTVEGNGVWAKPEGNITNLWLHQQGEYCRFFDENKGYHTILIANENPTQDKIFSNLEFRACIEGKEKDANTHNKDLSTLPFDTLETWNEYQKGILNLKDLRGHASMRHYWQDESSLKRKFRIWRCDIPRDGRNRMRNPWLYLKLQKDAADPDNHLNKTELHDFIVTYFS